VKIIRLDLIAFGPFTDSSLNFESSDDPLHLVFGHNEAGKSSCLRGLRQLLYGIPHHSTDNFVHPHGNLRIGGVLEDDQGQRLEIVRRKGRTKTLRASDDVQIVDPKEVQRILGGLESSAFEQRFGIDHQELVRGGREIASGGGELGEVLFSAGSGITELPQIQAGLDQEMRGLFVPGGSVPSINAAIRQLIEKTHAN
jgi:uncharacterized protein YhaN